MRAEETRAGGRHLQRERQESEPESAKTEREIEDERHFKRWEFSCGYSVPVFPLFERLT